MIGNYEKFLNELDKKLEDFFDKQKDYICCKKGCAICCSKGDYPYSQLEFTYLTQGFINLPNDLKLIIQKNIQKLLEEKQSYKGERFEHKCPFLINDECSVYKYRGIICRTFGLCYYDDVKDYVRLPGCVYDGLNYSNVFDKNSNTLNIDKIIKLNLRTDKILQSKDAKKYNLEMGEIRPILDWFGKKY